MGKYSNVSCSKDTDTDTDTDRVLGASTSVGSLASTSIAQVKDALQVKDTMHDSKIRLKSKSIVQVKDALIQCMTVKSD